jgi:hypothetical protein
MTTYTSPFAGNVIDPTQVSYAAYTIIADTYFVWPINGNTSTNVMAQIMEITAGTTTGLSCYMPPANQVSVGQATLIKNTGTATFTVKTNTGTTIGTVASGLSIYIFITDNTTVGGTWDIINFGASASAANASTLAGYGLYASSATLNVAYAPSTVSNGYTFQSSDTAQTLIWGGGVGSATLPASASVGSNWFILFKNNGTGTFTINASGADTLDLQSSVTYQPNSSSLIISTGASYVTVGLGVGSNFFFTALTLPLTTGTVTLTTTQASSIIQEYTGSLTGNVTVVFPPVVNLYVISNQCTTNGHTITVTTGVSGGANALIPAGQQVSLICDGKNFYNANTTQAGTATTVSLIDGTAVNPSLTFAAETTTGLFRSGPGTLSTSILGTDIVDTTSSGVTVYGSGTFTTGVSGGSF